MRQEWWQPTRRVTFYDKLGQAMSSNHKPWFKPIDSKNGMLHHSFGGAVIFPSLQHFIVPALDLMPCCKPEVCGIACNQGIKRSLGLTIIVVYFNQQTTAPYAIRWSKLFVSACNSLLLFRFPFFFLVSDGKWPKNLFSRTNKWFLTSEWCAEHGFAGRNTQHISVALRLTISVALRLTMSVALWWWLRLEFCEYASWWFGQFTKVFCLLYLVILQS